MIDVILPIGVLAMLVLFVDQLRRVISHAILNGTIRKAIEKDPASVPLLLGRLEPRRRWPDALGGWILLVAGVALAVAALFEDAGERAEIFEVAVVSAIIGAATLAYAWWVERATPRD